MDAAEMLENHIKTQHADQISLQQLPLVVEQSRRPVRFIQPSECPLCDKDWAVLEPKGEVTDTGALVVTIEDFRRHLGKHLQRIALFSLPRQGRTQEANSSAVIGGTSDRSLFSITSLSLEDQILEALVVSTFPPGSHQVYMPRGCLGPLVTEQSIIIELTRAARLDDLDQINNLIDEGLITYILTSAQKVFAICLICGVKGPALHEAMKIFMSTEFSDSSLPIQSTDPGENPWSQLQWTVLVAHKFRQRQWMFLVPIFPKDTIHMDLEPHHILPFTLALKNEKEGEFNHLLEIIVHEAHQEEPMRKVRNPLVQSMILAD